MSNLITIRDAIHTRVATVSDLKSPTKGRRPGTPPSGRPEDLEIPTASVYIETSTKARHVLGGEFRHTTLYNIQLWTAKGTDPETEVDRLADLIDAAIMGSPEDDLALDYVDDIYQTDFDPEPTDEYATPLGFALLTYMVIWDG